MAIYVQPIVVKKDKTIIKNEILIMVLLNIKKKSLYIKKENKRYRRTARSLLNGRSVIFMLTIFILIKSPMQKLEKAKRE